MASLKDAERLTQHLDDLVGQLRSELNDSGVDFEKVVALADELSEQADGLAETFSSVNDTLMQRIEQVKSGTSRGSNRRSSAKSEPKAAVGSS
jgi:hypothetical protein